MLSVACVQVNDYLGRGEEYVSKLRAMVSRNLREPYKFVCIDRDEGRPGWWAKTLLFRPGLFKGRVLYLDLDSVVTGSLDELAATKGIIYLTDWGWKTHTYGSGVMVFDGGEHHEIYELYDDTIRLKYRGDQDLVTALGGWERLPPFLCRSYRYHAVNGPPADASVVCFHGVPKPHELPPQHWASAIWTL